MDADLICLLDNPYLTRRRMQRKRRKHWVNPILMKRIRFGEFHHLHSDLIMQKEKFFEYYRMNLETFQYILNAIRPSITKWSNFRETISPEERLALTLRYLATGCTFKTLGYSFRISDVTVGRIVKEICELIWGTLQATHMSFPKDEPLKEIVEQFWNRWGFPNCVGCIDGKHVAIKNPSHSGSMYRNYKNFFSIILQGVAGPDYKFIAIHVGAYGKESDGGVFSHSSLSKALEKGAMGAKCSSPLPGSDITVPNVILGDEGYPLKTYLMRPFPVSKLGPSETIFNKRLSKARQVVECAFGILCSKWRLLLSTIELTNTEDIDTVVQCMCLLHNIIIDIEGEDFAENFTPEETNSVQRFASSGENRSTKAAYDVREKFKNFFCSEINM